MTDYIQLQEVNHGSKLSCRALAKPQCTGDFLPCHPFHTHLLAITFNAFKQVVCVKVVTFLLNVTRIEELVQDTPLPPPLPPKKFVHHVLPFI